MQAEDGIRDFHVTGVQTCALPISPPSTGLSTGCRGQRKRGGPQPKTFAVSLVYTAPAHDPWKRTPFARRAPRTPPWRARGEVRAVGAAHRGRDVRRLHRLHLGPRTEARR